MSALPLWAEWAVGLLAVAGGAFALVGGIGLVRLPDFYMRLHAPTKATTLGVGFALIASMLYFSLAGDRPVLHELGITLFLFVTAPVSAHLLSKAAMSRREGERPPEPNAEAAAGGPGPSRSSGAKRPAASN